MPKIGDLLLLLRELFESSCRALKIRQPHAALSQPASGMATVEEDFGEGIVAVRVAGKVGFADTGGNVVIPAQFRSAEEFRHGLACVSIGRKGGAAAKYGYVDHEGRYAIWPRFTFARSFTEGLGCVAVGGRFTKVHLRGKEHEVLIDAKYGFVDHQGRFVIEPVFDYAGSFADGLAYVREGESWTYIDHTGRVVISDADFLSVNQFSEGLAPVLVLGRGYGYINREGNFVIPPRFTTAAPFRSGYAVVGLGEYANQRYGYIDRSGRIVTRALRQDVSF